jgi:hypothetical protein
MIDKSEDLSHAHGSTAFFWGCTLLGSAIGLLEFVFGVGLASSAPQEAAAASIAIAWAVIPYVMARSFENLWNR